MKSRMKSMIAMLSLAFPLALTAAGPSAEEMAFYKAYKNGAQAKECLRVVDQDGMPVVGAKIDGSGCGNSGSGGGKPRSGGAKPCGARMVIKKTVACNQPVNHIYSSVFYKL